MRPENTKVEVVNSSIPKELFEELDSKETYHAFIDIGAHFTSMTNREVAHSFLEFFEGKQQKIKAVIYFEGDQLACLKRGSSQPIFLTSTDPKAIKMQTDLDPEEIFGYFDEGHATGSNLPLFWKTKACVTIPVNLTTTKLLQGVKRLRGLGKGMTITTLLSNSIVPTLKKRLHLSNSLPSVKDLVILSRINESEKGREDNLRTCFAEDASPHEKGDR